MRSFEAIIYSVLNVSVLCNGTFTASMHVQRISRRDTPARRI